MINISWVRYKEKKCMTAIIAASFAFAFGNITVFIPSSSNIP